MGLGRRKHRQDSLWVATRKLLRTGGHMFYERVNRVLDERGFARFAEDACAKFYAPVVGPGRVLPDAVDRLLRRPGFGRWYRLAMC